MSRLADLFTRLRSGGRRALVPYLTAGDPGLEVTYRLMLACEQAGADIIELGIPFSDPMADGPVIQAAAHRALQAGTTLAGVLATVQRLRQTSNIPVVFLVYYNTICSRGEAAFIHACATAGVDGLVVPDLPINESGNLRRIAQKNNIDVIQMLAPTSTPERQSKVVEAAAGFIYCVSLMGVTGARESLPRQLQSFLTNVRRHTNVPLVVGFGISSPNMAAQAATQADGIIVGSALIDHVEKTISAQGDEAGIQAATSFLAPFRQALDTVVVAAPLG